MTEMRAQGLANEARNLAEEGHQTLANRRFRDHTARVYAILLELADEIDELLRKARGQE